MVLGAPAWSDLSPQFMHGYPRRLVTADHGGFLPGNVCVAARISNQFMRSMAPGDIAGFCYRQAMSSLGLTLPELFLARQSALAYSGQARQPQRLVHSMVRYGIDFLTFSALGSEELVRLDELGSALNRRHAENLSPEQYQHQEGDEQSTSDTDGAVSEDSVELESSFLADRLSQSDREKLGADLPRLKTQLLEQFGGGASAPPPRQPPDEGTSRPRARSSTSAAQSSGSSSTRRRRSRREGVGAVATVEDAGSGQQVAAAAAAAAAPPGEEDLGQRLARVPGISVAHLPSPSALASLREFFRKHVPVERAVSEHMLLLGQITASPFFL